jgi:site-specific recombinase XerD
VDTGLRRMEVEQLTLAHLRRRGSASDASFAVQVVGKGGRMREVPVLARTAQALADHVADRVALARAGRLPKAWAQLGPAETPLLSVLRYTSAGGEGAAFAGSGVTKAKERQASGRLDAKTLYGILKRFFVQVADGMSDADEAQAMRRGSTHWLRHTFAHRVLAASKGELTVVQSLLGHRHLSTTAIYTAADLTHATHVVASTPMEF